MRDAVARAITDQARLRDDLILVVADISPAAALRTFLDENPTRIVDVGVSEQAMIGMAAGLALKGFRPFAYTIAPFAIFRPLEQIRVDLCYQELPVVVIGVGAGLSYSALGSTHHTPEDVAIASALPNMTVVAPCDPPEVEAAVAGSFSVRGPMYLRTGKSGEPDLTSHAPEPFELGRIRLIRATTGARTAVLSYGPIMGSVLGVAEELGAPVDVFSVHTLKPLDTERLDAILRTYERVVVVEEHVAAGGLGMQVRARAAGHGQAPIIRSLHLEDAFLHTYGSKDDLLAAHGITPSSLAAAIIGAEDA